MGGGLLQIAANSAIDPVFNDPNYTLFKAVYHKYTPFSIQDYTLKLSSMSDFGKKMEITIPKVGDLLTDAVLVVDLPQIQGEYTFTNQSEYLNSLTSQYTFSTMTDIQQYNENLYKLDLGNNISAYLVRDSQINKYQLMLPLLDATMFLTQGKTQKYSLDSFLEKNSQFFDNQYNLHVIQNLTYAINSTITNIDYLNYAFQDKEFYFFIANLLNIKQIDPTYSIKYYNDWEVEYYKTVKKYILKSPEIVALNTFIENMNTEITNSIKINNYIFDYSAIFSLSPFENQYNIILPISFTNNFYLTYKPFELVSNNKNYLIDSTVSFFSIFNKRYILVKRNNEIIGAVNIIQLNDTTPVNLTVKPFRHIYTNNLLNNNSYPLFIYYGFNTLQFEPINFAIISTYKLNINKYHEFTLDRSIQITVGSIIIIGINSTELPSNNYNQIYGIFKIIQVRKSFTSVDQFTDSNYNTVLTAQPIEIDQLLSTDTLLISSNTNITSNTYYSNYNNSVASTYTKSDLINLIKQTIYTDVTISTLITTPIVSISEYLLRQSVFGTDFVLTPSVITTLQSNIETYLIDSYDVLFNYLTKIYNKTIIKSSTNQDYLNNIYYKVDYQQELNIFNFIGAGTTTFANLVNGVFRYQQYIENIINSHINNDDEYVTVLSYTNFLTTHIINQYQLLSVEFNNEWSASLLNISENLSDTFIKIINYVQAGNTSGRQTLIKFMTNSFSATKSSITNLTITYKKRDVSLNTISNFYYVTYTIPLNLIVSMTTNYIVLDHTNLCLSIKDAFNLQNIDLSSMTFNYIDNTNNKVKLNVINLTTYLDNYSSDLIAIINSNTSITTQLYGNNILLDYLNVQNDTMFGLMKNYELYRQTVTRNGGTKYAIYQEDVMDQNPLLIDNTFMITFLSDQYYPRYIISKQMQLYQNIYQKINELSQNYATEPSSIYFMNNLNYERTDGYNYLNNAQGSIQFLDPLQIPTIINSSEYAYTLLDKVSKAGIIITPQTFSFIHYLEELEEHTISLQNSYLESYWNTIFAQSGETTTNINNYFAALASKDDALLIYYCYKYMTELLCYLSEAYNLQIYSGNLDDTYFKTIYQLSPQVLGTTFFTAFLTLMKITQFSSRPIDDYYKQYNSIIQGSQTLYDYFNYFQTNSDYIIDDNVQFNQEMNNLFQEMSYVFQVITRLTKKYDINIALSNGLSLSNYPCVYKIHGSGKLVKVVLVSDQYIITNAQSYVFNSSMVFPTNYYVDDYYKIFNLSLHYDYLKYVFFAGYGGILRDVQYPSKTLSSFYQKINNFITASVNNVDFAFFYANQTETYLPNMEGYIIQTYQGWIQRNTQPYFYYYNTLSSFYDMMYIYSGRSFISEYYTTNSNNTLYNNRPDTIRGATIYSTRMAYGTRDLLSRYNGVSKRYNLLDQRLFGIDNNFNKSTILNYDTTQDPIQIIQLLTILNQRFTDYQEFLVLMKNSMNVAGSYIQNSSTDNYATFITQFKVNSVSMTDLDIFNGWNSYISNYYLNTNYKFSSIISGLSNTISLYNIMNASTLDYSSLGYELYNFINNFNAINQRNFADKNLLRYENGTLYHNLINELNQTLTGISSFSDKNNLINDINYRNTNYSLISLDFLNTSLSNIVGPYQSDVSTFKQLFTSILNYRQKNVSTTAQSIDETKLYDDYYSINDVTSLTFYDKFFKFNSNIDYNLIPLVYHDLYNIQNASHTVVFYLNYLYSFLNNTSSKPNIADFDDDTLPISYYFPKYLSSGIDYFLSNFHQLKFDSLAFYPYKSVPANITLYDGTVIARPKSFMYVFLLMKIQYRNYYYSTVDNAYSYINRTSYTAKTVRNIINLNTYDNYQDIKSDVAAFDTLIDGMAVNGAIDHLQNIIHPFFVNKHIDNLLFIKDLLTDLLSVPDDASLYTILGNNDNYITFLNEKTIVTNAFDNSGLIFGQYPYTLGVLSDYNTMGYIPIIDSTGTTINVYIEGNIVLPSLITKIYYFLISECFILNQTELIGSSFQTTPMSLGNILGQITAKDWKSGLINLISEYLFLLLKSKKIIYQNSIYEISFNDIYTRLKVNTNADTINDLMDMYINSLLKITLTSFTVQSENNTTTLTSYLGEYEQFKIPNVFSLITIKKNFNYSGYYRLIFALRQSLIGVYNDFQERVQFHNAFDYWTVNNKILISDYTTISFNNNNYMIRKSEQSKITSGLTYYSTHSTNIPPNLFTTIIDYIISNVQNSINGGSSKYGYFTKYDFKNFVYIKNGYDVTLTLYNIFFTNINELYDISINTGSKTITATPTSGSLGLPFSISYSNLPFGYYYDFINDTLQYQQLLYQNDITYVLQNMFTLFKNFQDITSSLSLLASYSEPFSTTSNISHYEFIYFPTFIESFIYYDFTSKTDPTKQVNAVILPTNAKIKVNTLFNLIFTNWSEFYGIYYYVYLGTSPTAANLLGTGVTQFINGTYVGSLYIQFNVAGKQYVSITNALIDDTHPFGSSSVAVNILTPITISSISDGTLDNTYAIRTIPRSFLIGLNEWQPSIGITQLYTFFSLTSDGNDLTNAAGVPNLADGPFNVEEYIPPGNSDFSYRINAIVAFAESESLYVYVCDKSNTSDFNTAQVFALIPNITKAKTINIVSDIENQSKVGQLDNYTGLLTLSKTYTIILPFWSSEYRISELYVYFADNISGTNLGNDVEQSNIPQARVTLIKTDAYYYATFAAGFKNLGNNYVYLTYNQISQSSPYGSLPVNFLLNPTNPIVTTRIENVTGILSQYISIIDQETTFTVTLGNWNNTYTSDGVTKLYIYIKNVSQPNVYTSYVPINNLPDQQYEIVNNNGVYQVVFTTRFTIINQLYVYLTFNQISETYNYGEGLVNIQITNPPGDLVTFNYIDVINPFYADYITNTLTTFQTNNITIKVNNFSPNYNIYLTVPNQLYIFLASANNPTSIYSNPTPIVFDNNSVLNYSLYTQSINPVYIFISETITYGTGLIAYSVGSLNNIIGPVNGVLTMPMYVINNKARQFNISLTNWDSSYATIDNITKLNVYIGPNISTSILDFGSFPISQPNNYIVNFVYGFSATPSTYNVFIQDSNNNLQQQITNQLLVSDPVFINTLTPNIIPVPTFTQVSYTGSLGNWNTKFPSQLYLFTGLTINQTTPVNKTVTINQDGSFSFTTQVTQFPITNFAFSDAPVYTTGYIETVYFQVSTIIGPINAYFNNQSYAITTKPTNYSILLENWDPTYPFSSVYVYIKNNNNLLWNFGSQNVSLVNGVYYLLFSATITSPISSGAYTVTISNTNYNVSGYNFLQTLTNPLTIILQIVLDHIDVEPSPFATYTLSTFTGYINNWIASIFPSQLYIDYFNIYDNTYYTDTVTVNQTGVFTYVKTISSYPGIIVGISDNVTYGNGYLESQQLTLNNIIGPVNANLTTDPYTLLLSNKTYNIILTNWNTSYSSINKLYIYLGSNINTSVFSYGIQTIQFNGTNYYINFTASVSNITQGSYNLYLSDQNPTNIINPPLVNQFISLFSVSEQIAITNITTNPTPFATYTSTIFNGQLSNWFPLNYPSTLNIFYITTYDITLTTDTVTINSNGTFSYTNINNTLPGVTIAVSDSTTYGTGYIESNVYTVNAIVGPVNSVLTTNPYAIFTLSTNYNIKLTVWNASYPTNMYIYLGSDINTLVYSYGIQTVDFDGTNYTISFSATLPDIGQNQYNLYMSDQNPTNIITPRLVNQFINIFNAANQISISNITPNPNPIKTYTQITYSGQLTNWFPNVYPSTLNLFYTISSDDTLTVTPTTINTNGTFTYVDYDNTLPGVTIAVSNAETYSSGYIKSNIYTLYSTIGPINATITASSIIKNKTLSTTILLPNWNSSYNITSLYVYIGSNPNTLIESFGLQTIFLDTDNVYKMTFNVTPTTVIGSYQLYLSDTNPSTISYAVRQSITPNLTILKQIEIASITPTTFLTYQNTEFSGIINYWDASFYNKTIYVTYYSSHDNTYYNQPVTVSTSGVFSFTFMENYIANFNIFITDNVNLVYGNGYIESQVYTIASSNIKIGYTNTAFNNTYVIPNISTTLNFRINNWNSSYSLTQLYIYIGSNINTPIVSFGSRSIINTGGVYTISFSATITLNINTYTFYLCDSDPTIVPFPTFLINQTINNQLNLVNQIEVSSLTTTPSPVLTYTSANYSGTINNWLPSLFNPRLNVFIANNYIDFIVINNSGNFNFTSSSSIIYDIDTIKFSDNSTYSSGYLKTQPYNFSTVIGNINGTVVPFTYPINVSTSFTITLTNWNNTYTINTLYIFSATNTSFANLTSITSSTVNYTNQVYTVTFSTSFTGTGPYYFVISDVQNPTNNPYKVFQTINVPLYYFDLQFTPIELQTPSIISNPKDIPNLFMWFDANEIDGTYLDQPTNGSDITSWVNKTGMSVYNLSSVNDDAQFITNGISNLNSIYLNNVGLLANVPANSFINGLSVFIVYKNTGSTTSTVSLFNRNLVGDDTPYPINVYNASRDLANNTGELINSITSPFDISEVTTSNIFYFNTDSTLQFNEYANGTLNIQSSTSYFTDKGTQITIGIDSANNTGTTGFVGNISEILIYNRTLTSTERRTLEGYLAWKWNLVTSLPSTHPYSYLNPSFTIPVNTYIGFITPYEIILSMYTPIPSLTSFYVRYNTDIINKTNLVLIGNATIIQDENSNYVLRFNAQFPSANTYYLYLTDILGNIYKSISTPILVTNASSLITLTTPSSTVDQNTLITINLGGWSSIFDLKQVGIYYSTNPNDPNPTFLTNANIEYTFDLYSLTFLATPYGNLYFYIIGKKNNIILNKNSINITVNSTSVLTPYLNKNTNYILDPTTITGLTVWLDANMVSGSYLNQPTNGANVSTWVDKSGNNYNAIPAEGTPTFVTTGINGFPSVQLTTGKNYVCNVPTGTFDNGMTIFVVYKSVGTPSAYEALITRASNNMPDPFDMYNNTRIIGNGTNLNNNNSPININGNTTPSIFYANMDANNYIYLESNQFINVDNFSFDFWDDYLNDGELFIGTRADFTQQFNGYISEILIFNKSLSKLEQYKIEGYLAYKWKFEIYLPLYHPFAPIQSTIFTPLLFNSLQLWMDASNTNSYTVTDNNVTQWRDLSYLKNIANTNIDFNPVVTGVQNSLTTMIFNSSTMSIVNPNILANTTDVTLMFLINVPSDVASSSPFGNQSFPDSFPFVGGSIYTSFGITYSNIGTLPSGWIIYTVITSFIDETTNFYINGVNIYSGTYDNTYINSTEGWTIGCDTDNGFPMTATLAEMLVFNTSLSTDQRILMEGYLANKWGVNNLLPNSSPYITNPPTLLDYNNLLYGDLQLNLDASNINNFTFDNNNILTWTDTSTNNNSLSSVYSNPVLATNPVTNKTGVYFDYTSMKPSNLNKMVLNNDSEFSIFTVGYINNTDSNTRPTIISTNNNNNTSYTFNIRKNTNFINQINVTYPDGNGGNLYQLYGNLSSSLSNGLHNMNYNQTTDGSVYINGSSIQTLGNPITDQFSSNFYLGGIQSDINSFLQNSYIHQVLIYNKNVDELSRYIIEGQLAAKWNVTTSNSLGSLGNINTYKGINTLFTILLENWTLTAVTNIYVGYNTNPNNLTNLNIIGSFPIYQLNNMYYTSLNNIFGTSGTYYMHLVDQNNVEYTNINKSIVVEDLSTIIQTDTTVTLVQNQTYNLELKNWKSIVNSIGLYSNQITNFNLSIGQSSTDTSPVFVSNLPINYSSSIYILTIPGLTNVNNKYIFLSSSINGVVVRIPPILINIININLSINYNYGLLNTLSNYKITINSIPNFYELYPTIYLYRATLPNLSSGLTIISTKTVNNNNEFTFQYNSSQSIIYFYISTGSNYTGITSFVGPVNFVNSNTLSITLDTYDNNTNIRNILLGGWSPYFNLVSDLSIFNNTTLIETNAIISFTPNSISGIQTWLDGSLENNFILNTNQIVQWNDSSSNNNNATHVNQEYPIYDPINKGISFTGNNLLYLPDGTIPYNNDNYHIFIVLTPIDSTGTPEFILSSFNQYPPTSNNVNSFSINNNRFIQSWNNNSDLTSSEYTPETKQIVSFEYISGVNRTTYIDGVSSGTDNPTTPRTSTQYNNVIGGIPNVSTFSNLIHEIIIYKNALTLIERQKIESYLNNKWYI